jgi:hypothetical protein
MDMALRHALLALPLALLAPVQPAVQARRNAGRPVSTRNQRGAASGWLRLCNVAACSLTWRGS